MTVTSPLAAFSRKGDQVAHSGYFVKMSSFPPEDLQSLHLFWRPWFTLSPQAQVIAWKLLFLLTSDWDRINPYPVHQARHSPAVAEPYFWRSIHGSVEVGLFYGLRINDTTHDIVTLILLGNWADIRVENKKVALLLIGSMRKHFRSRTICTAYVYKLGDINRPAVAFPHSSSLWDGTDVTWLFVVTQAWAPQKEARLSLVSG